MSGLSVQRDGSPYGTAYCQLCGSCLHAFLTVLATIPSLIEQVIFHEVLAGIYQSLFPLLDFKKFVFLPKEK